MVSKTPFGISSHSYFFLPDPKYLYGIIVANEHAGVFKTGRMQIQPSFLGFSRDLSFPNFLVYLLFKRSAKRPLVSVGREVRSEIGIPRTGPNLRGKAIFIKAIFEHAH